MDASLLVFKRTTAACAIAMVLAACAAAPAASKPAVSPAENAILWTMRSAEYRASTVTLFAAAAAVLPELLADTSWTAALEQRGDALQSKPAAVVVDVDETLLNNSLYQWERVRSQQAFDEASWDAWVRRREARAVPGAVQYARRAAELGVTLFYVTNRTCRSRTARVREPCPQAVDTVENLVAVGFPRPRLQQLLLKGSHPEWGSEKSARRAHVAKRYRIIQLIGDDLGDFIAGARDADERRRDALVERHRTIWGRGWFLLPNPIYGSWERAAKAR